MDLNFRQTPQERSVITDEERAAIEAYTGPITICPPRTYSEGHDVATEFRAKLARRDKRRARRKAESVARVKARIARRKQRQECQE